MNLLKNNSFAYIRKVTVSFSKQKDWIYLFFFSLAIAAAVLIKYDMAWGPWAFSDSAAYISAARNLVAGHGLSVPTPQGVFQPLTLHQPLYPLIMSFFLLFDIHPLTTSVVINITSFSLSLLIFGAGAYYFSRSIMLSVCSSLLFIASPNLIAIYDGAMSEPLYLFLTVSSFYAVLLYIEKESTYLLLLASLLAGLSILTRYIGITNVVCGAILIFIFLKNNPKTRILRSIIFSGIAILPTIFWMIYGIVSSNQNSRSWLLPADLFQNFQSFFGMLFETFSEWLPFKKEYALSYQTELTVVIIIFSAVLILFAGTILIQRKSTDQKLTKPANLIISTGLYILVYLAIFYGAFAFSSLPPDVNTRTMVPLLPFLMLLVIGLLYFYCTRTNFILLMPLTLAFLTIWIVSSTRIATYDLVANRHLNGFGYTAKYWQGSTVLKAARDLPKDIPWISNEPAFFLLYLNKFPYDLTTIYPQIAGSKNLPFGNGGSDLDHIFREENAALLLHQPQFENDLRKLVVDSAAGRVEVFTSGLEIYQQSFDGAIYYFK